MKNALAFLSLIVSAALTANCNGGRGSVTTTAPPGGTQPPPPPSSNQLVYGNHFSSRDSSAYQSLLQICNRCGRKWLSQNYGGGKTYNSCSWLSSDSPLKCQNWSSQGYLQIEFAEKKLPTAATVTIWPQYIYRSHEKWGQSFSVKGEAQPINENEGFSIIIPPSSGLGGQHTLYVESEDTNHVHGGTLNVEARYGGGSGAGVIFTADRMPRVKKNPPALYSCRQRPPDLMSSGSILSFCLSFGH